MTTKKFTGVYKVLLLSLDIFLIYSTIVSLKFLKFIASYTVFLSII